MAETDSEITEFMMGDYKGNQAFSNFDKLPTVVGTADPEQVAAFLETIEAVIARRQQLLEG